MDLFRIAKKKFIEDLSGEGVRKFGGRWNVKNYAVLYTSRTESLAALETLVQASFETIQRDLNLLILSVPENIKPDEININQLPSNWRNFPSPNKLAEIGSQWIDSESSLLLEVPSVLVQTDTNVLINPKHSDMTKLSIKEIRPFTFDMQLFQS